MRKHQGAIWFVILMACLAVLAPTVLAADVPDFTQFGFPNVVASIDLAAGAGATLNAQITGGSLNVVIPEGAFTNAVRFQVITGPLSNFTAKSPSDDEPLMDFAFRVTDMTTGQLVGQFAKAVQITARNAQLTADSSFYNINTAGDFDENPTGLQASAGMLMHPVPIATVGWVITTPKNEIVLLPVTGTSGAVAPLWGAGVLALLVTAVCTHVLRTRMR